MAESVEFEWDSGNVHHLKRRRVLPEEFEEVVLNGPLDLEYDNEQGEERFKSVGYHECRTRANRRLDHAVGPNPGHFSL